MHAAANLVEKDNSLREAAKQYGISQNTLKRYIDRKASGAGVVECVDNATGECKGKFLKKGGSDPETDQPTFMFKVGDECSFPKSDIAMILPYPKIT